MVRDASSEYLNENNPLKTWLGAEFDRCDESDRRNWWRSSDLRDEYLSFSKTEASMMSANKFNDLMVMNGVTKFSQTNNFMGPVFEDGEWVEKPRKAGSYWVGLRRKTDRIVVD
jgi:hypothetical protein